MPSAFNPFRVRPDGATGSSTTSLRDTPSTASGSNDDRRPEPDRKGAAELSSCASAGPSASASSPQPSSGSGPPPLPPRRDTNVSPSGALNAPSRRSPSPTPAPAPTTDEEPPAYSEGPDWGETTVEHGPLRPFQQPPRQHQHQQHYLPTGASGSSQGSVGWRPPQRTGAISGAGVPDDGRPTSTPVPGHPLLNEGRILVYPRGFTCHKCNNTGYKHADPSHPCRTCWRKYAKPFTGAVTYTDFSSPDAAGGGVQRALPRFHPPLPVSAQPTGASYAPPTGPGAAYRQSHPGGGGGGLQVPGLPARPSSAPPPHPPQPPHFQRPLIRQIPPPSPYSPYSGYGSYGAQPTQPPPGSLVLQPGDPRIGGALCPLCDGKGRMPLIGGECWECKGLGRVFR